MAFDWKLTTTGGKTWQALQGPAPIIINTGGARSGKTFGTMQCLSTVAANNPGTRISCVSRSLPHIKKGAFRDFQTLVKHGLYQHGEMRWTDFTFHFYNGSYIEFFGLEDPDKAHGPGRDILFINEANFVPKSVFDQLAMRTTGKIILDLNPSEFNSWVYDVADDPKNINIHSTYLDNIANLSPNQIATIESYKTLPDQFLWQVYGLGLRGASEEIIYRGWQLVDDVPHGDVFYGFDFGYTAPCAVVKVTKYDGSLYVEQVLYKSGLNLNDRVEELKRLVPAGATIYCDTAEPGSIEELYRNGFNAHPSDKDVWAGIIKVKSYTLFIHRQSAELIRELQGYKWKKDKNDKVLEEPVKENDHLCDAMRYAIHTHLTRPVANFWTL
jgi:phage terminase large subunit